MKVTYFGNEYSVPDGTRAIATNEDGTIGAFTVLDVKLNTTPRMGFGYWFSLSRFSRAQIGKVTPSDDWMNSLLIIGKQK